jgi:hypothetical protein
MRLHQCGTGDCGDKELYSFYLIEKDEPAIASLFLYQHNKVSVRFVKISEITGARIFTGSE